MTISTFLAQTLKNNGVNTVFGIPSYVGMQILNALDSEGFTMVLNSHEQNAAHMAEGYFLATGKPAALTVAMGPGLTNALSGIANAYIESIPMIVITGTPSPAFIGRNEYHANSGLGRTLDEDLMLKSCTKGVFRVTNLANAESMIYDAIRTCLTGRPGPVVISIPPSLQLENLEVKQPLNVINNIVNSSIVDKSALEKFYNLYNKAQKPIFIFGKEIDNKIGESSDSSLLVNELMSNNAPYFTTYGAKGKVPSLDNYLGTAWYSNSNHIFSAIKESDLIIALGEDFTHFSTRNLGKYTQEKPIIQITKYAEEASRGFDTNLTILCDVNVILNQLNISKKPWQPKSQRQSKESETLRIIQHLGNLFPENAAFFADVGNAGYASITDLQLKEGQEFYTTGKFGICGWSLPAATGYAFSNKNSHSVSIIGDLAFNMNMQELSNIKKLNLNHTTLLFNNYSLQNIVDDQREVLGKYVQADIAPVDYEKLANAFGLNYYTARNLEELTIITKQIDFKNSHNLIELTLDSLDSPLIE